MPNCTAETMSFGRLGRCEIEANFEGGALSSDGGLMRLRQADRRIGLSKQGRCCSTARSPQPGHDHACDA